MCFSPEASFFSAAAIAAIGVMTLKKVKFQQEYLLASIPLLFATQQIIEGMLWLTLLEGGMPVQQQWLTQSYALYAGVLWPMAAPISILLIEPEIMRKNFIMLALLTGTGIAFATLKVMGGVGFDAQIINQCIVYDYASPAVPYVTWWSYVAAVCVPFLLSSQPVIRNIGMVNMAAFGIAYYAYNTAYISVWCFFAAITSGLIYFYFAHSKRQEILPIASYIRNLGSFYHKM